MVDHLPIRSDHGIAAFGSQEALHQIPMVKFLEYDHRPIFVINLAHERQGPDDQLHPFFVNQALYKTHSPFNVDKGLLTHRNVEDYMEFDIFLAWAKAPSKDGHTSQFHFGGIAWESLTLGGIWRVFSGTLLEPSRSFVRDDLVPGPSFTPSPTYISSNESSETNTETQPSATNVGETITQLNPSPRDTRRSSDSALSSDVHCCSQSTTSMEAGSSLLFFDDPATNATQEETPIAKRNADLLSKIAASGSIAIYILDIGGEIVFCNDAWYEISQHPRELKNAMSWMSIAADDEIPKIKKLWERVAIHQEPIQWQARLKRHWNPPPNLLAAPKDLPAWISGWSYPDISPEGKVIGVCGVLTDISEQKWMESLVDQKLADAIERASLTEQLSASAKEVVDSETRFRRLADLMPIGIWVSDQDGKMLYVNDAFRDIIPSSNDPNVIQPWWELVPREEMHKAQESYRELTELRIKSTVELRLKKSGDADDDEYRWIHLIGYPELREDGTLRHITGCIADITQLKLAEQAQSTRATDALKSKRQLEHFIDMTSHEIRNPLSAIIHSAEEIVSSLRHQGSELITAETITDVMEAAKTIIYCTDHSTRIVDDILLVSKLESGLVNINPTVIRPIDAVRRALKMFDGEMRAADITQSFLIDDSFQQLAVDWVYLDQSRMLQIFVNLITNAIKFTRPERTRCIDIHVAASGEKPNEAWNHFLPPQTETTAVCRSFEANDKDSVVFIRVTVRDTGCGLSEDEQKRLFRRFSQAGKRTHVKYGGTGLGLFISRQLSEMQGGQIGVHSVPQQGSVFSFYVMGKRALPHEQPLGTSGSIDQVRTGRVASISQPVAPPSLVAPSCPEVPLIILENENDIISPREQIILLVEDNLINQKVVAKKLKTEGFTVVVANNGLEALDHIRKSSLWSTSSGDAPTISLILLDIEMPIMDGLTCIRCIREMEKSGEIRSRIPVIAVTANARQERINQIKEAGMDDVITKPFRMNQLTPVMTGYLKQSSLSQSRRPSIPKFLIANHYVQAQKIVIPAPNGTYTVGRNTLQMINKDSIQPFSPVLEAPALVLSVFYPTDSSNMIDVPYMPAEVAQFLDDQLSNVPGINSSNRTFEQLTIQLTSNSLLITQSSTRWPLLIFSSASGANRDFYNALVSEVASSGYVVITFDTPYSTEIVLYSDGSIAFKNSSVWSDTNVTSFTTSVIAETNVRAQDISYMLGQLSNSTFASSVIPGCSECLNTSHIGVLGHSIGGATAAAAMLNDTRVAGASNLDGTLWGDVIQLGLNKPFMIMAKEGGSRAALNTTPPYDSWARIWPKLTSSKFNLILNNSCHSTFSDYPLVLELLGIIPANVASFEGLLPSTMNGTRAHHIVSTYITAFFDWLLKDDTAELIAAPSPIFPEIS